MICVRVEFMSGCVLAQVVHLLGDIHADNPLALHGRHGNMSLRRPRCIASSVARCIICNP